MALKEVHFGSNGPHYYDDTDTYDGGVTMKGVYTTGTMRVDGTPVHANDVARLGDIGTGLVSDAITVGTGSDVDIVLTFDANTNDGILTWMEDEDYFAFDDDILMDNSEYIYFGDTSSSIRHDGTNLEIADDAAIHLETNAFTLGDNTANDIVLTFNSNTNQGIMTWKDTGNTFEFNKNMTVTGSNQVRINDVNSRISSSTPGQLEVRGNTHVIIDVNGTSRGTFDPNGLAVIGRMIATNYYSGDNTKGLESFSGVITNLTVKDGLVTAAS